MKIIDLSFPIESNPSEPMDIHVQRTEYLEGAKQICREAKEFLKIDSEKFNESSFPDKMFISNEIITLSTHTGTHVDAPAHFGPICNGEIAKKINECPLEWFYGNGIVLNFKNKKPGEIISKKDIQESVLKLELTISKGDIILINTGTYKKWGTKEYFSDAPALSPEATEFLVNSGVKLIGIDTFGFDLPFPTMIKKYIQTEDKQSLWPNHFLGRKLEYLHIERLNNLDAIEIPFGFKFCAFPIKIKGGDAAWIRAVAIIE